jgi:AAA15 family ATPase/GTPase
MAFLERLKIENFRGIDSLEIDGLSKINLFVGKNNSGKTSILEALFLIFGMSNPAIPNNMNRIRGIGVNPQSGTAKQLKYLFHNLQLDEKPAFYAKFDASERWLELDAKFGQDAYSNENSSVSVPAINGIGLTFAIKTGQTQRKAYKSDFLFEESASILKATAPREYIENLYATYISADIKDNQATLTRYSDIVKKKGGEQILKVLQEVFGNNILAVQPLPDGIYFNIKDVEEYVPSNVMGDGIRRFLNIVTAVSEKQNSFILVDELENGLHYSTYKLLWKSLINFSEQCNVQLFITTHNIETLESLKSVLEETNFETKRDYAKVFSVVKSENTGIQTYGYSFIEFQTAIDNDIEIRE